MTECIFSPPY